MLLICMFLSSESYDIYSNIVLTVLQYRKFLFNIDYHEWHLSITYQVIQITFSYSAAFVSFDACLLV